MARPKKTEATKVAKEKVIEQIKETKPSVEKFIKESLNKVENFLYNKVDKTWQEVYDEVIENQTRINHTQLLIIIVTIILWLLISSKISGVENRLQKEIDIVSEELSIITSDVSDIYMSTYEIHNNLMPVDKNNCIQWADWDLYCKKE